VIGGGGGAWNEALPSFSAASQTGFKPDSGFTNAFAYDNPAFQQDLPTAMFMGNSYPLLRKENADDVAWNSCTMLDNSPDDKNAGIAPEASQAMECPIWNDLTDSTVQGLIGQDFEGVQDQIDNAAPALASSYNGQVFQVGDGSFGTDLGYALLMGDYSTASADALGVQSEMVAIENFLYYGNGSGTQSSAYLAGKSPGSWKYTCLNEFTTTAASDRASVQAACWQFWQLYPYFDAYQVFRNLPAECPLVTKAKNTSTADRDAIESCQLSIAFYLEGMLPVDLGGENSVANPFEGWVDTNFVGMDPTINALGWTNVWQEEMLFDSGFISWAGCPDSLKSFATAAWMKSVDSAGPLLSDMTTWEDGGYEDSLAIKSTEEAYAQVNLSSVDLILGVISGAVVSAMPGQQAVTTAAGDQSPPQQASGDSNWPSWTMSLTCPSS